jgi:hypothetical protein
MLFHNNSSDEFFDSFKTFWTSLFKVTLMLAGEYSLELPKLNAIEMLFVSSYVLVTFWLYALIIGFTVTDINEIKQNARTIILIDNANKIIGMQKLFMKIYKQWK